MDSLEEFLAASYDRAYRTAWLILRDRADAEEAVQEAYLRVWRFRDSLPEGEAMKPWLYRVLVNASVSLLRREKPRAAAVQRAAAQPQPDARSPEVAAIDAEASASVLAAIAELPEHLRVPLVLRYWSGLSEREIAEAIQRRPGTVKSRLHEAKRRLADDPRIADLAPSTARSRADDACSPTTTSSSCSPTAAALAPEPVEGPPELGDDEPTMCASTGGASRGGCPLPRSSLVGAADRPRRPRRRRACRHGRAAAGAGSGAVTGRAARAAPS